MVITITQEELNKMNSSLNFESDLLNVGLIGEGMGRQYFEQVGATFIRISNEDERKQFDFIMEYVGDQYKVEVKTDNKIRPTMQEYSSVFKRMMTIPEYETGNIFIEFSSRGNNSGINITEADIWVNFFHHLNEVWIIRVDKLKELISKNDFEVFSNAGDVGSETHGYLIPRFIFKEHFKVIKYERIII